MLEGRKLSLEMQRDSHGRLWTIVSLLISVLCLMLLASLWIGLTFAPPPPDKSQDNMAQAHAKVLEVLATLKASLAPDQTLNAELYADMVNGATLLTEFSQLAAKGTQKPADSIDAQTWPGRANLILQDLNTLVQAKEPTLNFLQTRDALSALYKPKGPLLPQASAPLTAYRELSNAVSEWSKATAAATPTWAALNNAKTPWRQINVQMDALEAEAKLTDNAAQAKPAQLLLTALSQNNLMANIRSADEPMTKVWSAHERLLNNLDNLPPVPVVIVPPAGFSWSQLAFPGSTQEGLMGIAALLVIGLSVFVAAHISRQRHLKLMAHKWLGLSQQLENTLREVTQALTHSVHQQDALVAEFNPLLEQSRTLQQTLNTPLETPEKTLEDQAWRAAARMQSDLESELQLLREKLLNIHLQFCSGATHENLVYDLAFTAEGIQTVLTTASDLGRSFAILKEHLHQPDAVRSNPEVAEIIAQMTHLKNSVKRMSQQLRDLSNKLQVAVEDVPDGKRFDTSQSPYASRGGYGNPSV